MKKSIRNKWIKALRSDEYEQGRGQLAIPVNEHDAFCCLGVLCDVLGEEFEQSPGKWAGLGVSVNGAGLECFGLPMRILKETGLSCEQSSYLTYMNDGGCSPSDGKHWKKQSLTQIARWIEKHL